MVAIAFSSAQETDFGEIVDHTDTVNLYENSYEFAKAKIDAFNSGLEGD